MDELLKFAASAAPPLVGTFTGALLAFLSNFYLARVTARRQWRTERLSGFVRRAYEIEPGFERALVTAERGDTDGGLAILNGLVLRQDAGLGRAWQADEQFRRAAADVLYKKGLLHAVIENAIR